VPPGKIRRVPGEARTADSGGSPMARGLRWITPGKMLRAKTWAQKLDER
jgi:hypothetical protein